MGVAPENPITRLLSKIEVQPDGCWRYVGIITKEGYGRIKVKGKMLMAHRLSCESLVGPIPEGLHIDHLCRNRYCINPDHLEPVTCQVNLLRSPDTIQGRNAGKFECVNGHRFTEENTILRKSGGRGCRTCNRIRLAAWRQRTRTSTNGT